MVSTIYKMSKSWCWMNLKFSAYIIGGCSMVFSLLFLTIAGSGLSSLKYEDEQHVTHYELWIPAIMIFIVSALAFLSSIMLIMGTIKGKHKMLIPWFIFFFIVLVFGLMYTGAILFYFHVVSAFYKDPIFWPSIVAIIPETFGIYVYYGGYKLFKELKHSDDRLQLQSHSI